MDLFTTSAGESRVFQDAFGPSPSPSVFTADLYTNIVPPARNTPLSAFHLATFGGYSPVLLTTPPAISSDVNGLAVATWLPASWETGLGVTQLDQINVPVPCFGVCVVAWSIFPNGPTQAAIRGTATPGFSGTATAVAAAVAKAMAADSEVSSFLTVTASGTQITLAHKSPAPNNASFVAFLDIPNVPFSTRTVQSFNSRPGSLWPFSITTCQGITLTDTSDDTLVAYAPLPNPVVLNGAGQSLMQQFSITWGG